MKQTCKTNENDGKNLTVSAEPNLTAFAEPVRVRMK